MGEYIGFVKAMNALKGMKLCYKDRETERAWTSNIKVDFDKTKHLADSTSKARKQERERLVKEERDKERSERQKKELEEMKQSQQMKLLEEEDRERGEKKMAKMLVASQRRMAREEKRKAKTLRKMGLTEGKEMERAYEKYFSSLARKEVRGGPRSEEQAKEEQWERMTNPHLFGGSGGGGFRKVKPGQHYEEVQKETLQHEIRIRERREKMSTDREDHRYRERKGRESRRERW